MQRTITAPDGRDLDVRVEGAEAGPVILVHGGTPACGYIRPADAADAAERGARIVTIARPGYAGSTRKPGRAVADVVEDVRAVLDALDIDRCVSWGASGGGPHVLACATLLPDRVATAACLAGVAPYDSPGLDFMAGMGQDNLDEFGAALEGERSLRDYIEPEVSSLAAIRGENILEGAESLISAADRAVLTGDFAEATAAALRHAVSTGGDGWIDDDLAFTRPWGFDLTANSVPILLWQGDQDLMVPAAHGAWLAEHLPLVEAHLSPDDGHLTITARRIPEIHSWLLNHL